MQTVREKKTFLISTLSADPKFILQHAQQEKIITQREYNNLHHSKHTNEDIVINLLDTVMNKGNDLSSKFLNLLQRELIQECFPNLKELFIPPPASHTQGIPVQTSDKEDDCYPVTKRPLGYCLIINNYTFKDGSKYNYRKGTDADKDALFRVFSRMHFSVVERRDLASSDMMKAVKEFAEMDHSKMDVFVCCILSHGEKGTVIGSDCEPVQIRDLTQHFAQCPTLTGKPKLFFIQACQGDKLQRGVWTQDGFEETEEYEDDSKKNSLSHIPIEADFLIGMSTVESYKSFRHTTDGSIFIQELCKQLTNGCPRREDILTILTKVNCKVGAQDPNGKKQMPEPRYTLTRKLVLPMD